MKASFVVANYMCSRTFLQPPVEFFTVAALLKKRGYYVQVCDFRVLNQTTSEATRTIDADADLIVISVSPYDMPQMYHMDYRYRYTEYFDRVVKAAFPHAVVFAEGAQCTLKPEEFLRHTGLNGVMLWEIERTVCDLADAVAQARPLENVPNLVLSTPAGKFTRTAYDERYAYPDETYFDVMPLWELADFSGYFGYDLEKEKHSRLYRWGVILGARGCAFSCAFCFNFYKNRTRYRPVQHVADEMEYLSSLVISLIGTQVDTTPIGAGADGRCRLPLRFSMFRIILCPTARISRLCEPRRTAVEFSAALRPAPLRCP